MDKAKISQRRKKSSGSTSKINLKLGKGLVEYSPSEELLDETFIAVAVWDCLKNNDPQGVLEIVEAHLTVVNKQKRAKEVHLPRSTLYNSLKRKKSNDPHTS